MTHDDELQTAVPAYFPGPGFGRVPHAPTMTVLATRQPSRRRATTHHGRPDALGRLPAPASRPFSTPCSGLIRLPTFHGRYAFTQACWTYTALRSYVGGC